MALTYNSIEELIGNTPLLRLEKIERAFGSVGRIYAKLEFFNPAGSAKDRVARQMLDNAEANGLINSDSVIIEGSVEVNESLLTGEAQPIRKNIGELKFEV